MFHGTLLVATGDDDAGLASLDEAIRLSRAQGAVVNLAYALIARAQQLPRAESHRAIALANESLSISEEIGGYIHANSLATRAWGHVGVGDWRAGLRDGADVAALALRVGVPPDTGLFQASLALAALGHPEPAAVAIGASDDFHPLVVGPAWAHEPCIANERALVEILGDEEFAALTAWGASLGAEAAVAFVRAEADRALGDEAAS